MIEAGDLVVENMNDETVYLIAITRIYFDKKEFEDVAEGYVIDDWSFSDETPCPSCGYQEYPGHRDDTKKPYAIYNGETSCPTRLNNCKLVMKKYLRIGAEK